MRAAVFGAGGLLGRALSEHLRSSGDEVLALPRAGCDIADEAAVLRALDPFRPEAILNAAAWTDVDRAEREPDLCFRANAGGPRVLARAARRLGARLVHVSTDYVFDGEKGAPYDERDDPAPRGVYARSKFEGERAALDEGPAGATVVARSAWVYGPGGKNFVSKIPEVLRARGEIAAVADQWSSPTRADELAAALRALAAGGAPGASGVVHVAARGAASYYDCALVAAEVLGVPRERVLPAEGASLVRPAPRPRFTALASVRLAAAGLAPLRPWAESYREYARGFATEGG